MQTSSHASPRTGARGARPFGTGRAYHKAGLAWALLADAAWVGAYPTQAQLEHIRAERRHDRRSPRVVVNALAAEKDDEENERPRTIRPWPEP